MVGGFLGAGKTTLLFEATKYLMQNGKRVGLITNDQASELVDTAILLQTKATVAEVSGSCFCCNYKGFIDSIQQVNSQASADFIIAEPVGSCTDLSATLMQPMKDHLSRALTISPLTVLADPLRLTEIFEGKNAGLHPSAVYIFQKQLEESDVILISKSDLLHSDELMLLKEEVKQRYPNSMVLSISSKTGEGIAEWINVICESTRKGNQIVEVDYNIYAEGEAVLGWLNASISLTGNEVNWDNFVMSLLNELSRQFDLLHLGVGHVKVIMDNATQCVTGNITGNAQTIQIRGTAGASGKAQIIINARVGTSPDKLDQIVKDALRTVADTRVDMKINNWKCLSPGYPRPTYRYNKVI